MSLVSGEVVFGSPVPVCSENRLRWDLSPEQILQLSNELIANTKKVYDHIGALDLDSLTTDNTLKALADVEVEYTGQSSLFQAADTFAVVFSYICSNAKNLQQYLKRSVSVTSSGTHKNHILAQI